MANEVFKTPDVYVKETDNTFVRDTNNTVYGTGAITLKANQGPVNQRLLFTRFQDFQQVFGKPTTEKDYGHFAARLYMSVAPSLYAVRVAYGDESYATIQFPREINVPEYRDALSAGNPYTTLTTTGEVSDLVNLVKIDTTIDSDGDDKTINGYSSLNGSEYIYTSKAVIPENGLFYNLKEKREQKSILCSAELNVTDGILAKIPLSDDPTSNEIKQLMLNSDAGKLNAKLLKGEVLSTSSYSAAFGGIESATYNGIEFTNNLQDFFQYDEDGKLVEGANLDSLFNIAVSSNSAWATTDLVPEEFRESAKSFNELVSGYLYYPVQFEVNKFDTMDFNTDYFKTYISNSSFSGEGFDGINDEVMNISVSANGKELSGSNILDLSSISIFSNTESYESGAMQKIENCREWESNIYDQTYLVSGTPFSKPKNVHSITFTNYGMGDEENWLVAAYAKVSDFESTEVSEALEKAVYYNYGTNAIEAKDYIPYVAIRVDNYEFDREGLPSFIASAEGDFNGICGELKKQSLEALNLPKEGIIEESDLNFSLLLLKNEIKDTGKSKTDNDALFAVYQDVNDLYKQPTTTSVFKIVEETQPTVPVNIENTSEFGDDAIKVTYAIPTNQALVMYPDGYTKTSDTDEEPGIADLESVKPWLGNSLVIGAIGPGKYANDIGIAIVTPDMHEIKALNIPNAFDWMWRFDDEDKVKNSMSLANDMIANPDDYTYEEKLVWTQVYKINVYRKPSDKSAEDAWGTGKEAMVSNIPVESFYVSNDPKLVDGEGKSLYAPNVINGTSNYIYITRSSVQSMEGKLPKQTFGIFPLIGGKDGSKSGLNQKQAGLQLYSDPNKANFDIIFNTDAIESFASREKARAAQIKFGEIAGSRGDALAIVQATSLEAKKLSKGLAEGKGFSFEYPSYVAMYAGYDKYFDPDLSTYIYLPKSVAAAVTEGYIMYNQNPWEAPGGVDYGSIEYTTGNQLLAIDANDLGELYSNNINCSRTMPIYGEVLWGNKTAQKKNTALRSINVRVLMNYIKKNVKTILTPYIFRNNTDVTRAKMKNQLVDFFEGIRANGGLTNPRVRVWCSGEDLMNHIVRVELGFIPPYDIEFIPVNIVLDSANNTIDILEA